MFRRDLRVLAVHGFPIRHMRAVAPGDARIEAEVDLVGLVPALHHIGSRDIGAGDHAHGVTVTVTPAFALSSVRVASSRTIWLSFL